MRQDLLRTDVTADPTIIALDKAVFVRRLKTDEPDEKEVASS